VETHLWGGWTAKAEYLYMDLGSISDTFTVAGSGTFSTTSNFRDHITRAGLNYKFY
jgi:outer membrane immunogenic protein